MKLKNARPVLYIMLWFICRVKNPTRASGAHHKHDHRFITIKILLESCLIYMFSSTES